MRLGVIDVGSNAAQLQVVEARAGAPPLPIHAVKVPTRLGEEAGIHAAISREGADRVVAAVQHALAAARELRVEQLCPFVTAAIRDASNRDVVLERILDETGVRPQYLTGEQEARLTYSAVRNWYGWQAGSLLNIDIGGGSMELAFGRDAVPELAVSLPLGASRVTTDFLQPDPPSNAQIKELRRHVRRQVREVANRVQWEGRARRVVATSKTFKQLARLSGAPRGRDGPFVRRTVSKEQVQECIRRLALVPAKKRAHSRGIRPSRAWQILGGAVVAYETMRCLRIESAEVSPWALREGIMLEHLASLRTDEQLTLQPLTFIGSVEPPDSATLRALPSQREAVRARH
jgi:exopolyphosphatase/guanosine-5'-triphosphate,3'-diphosphate pyrophosphatase